MTNLARDVLERRAFNPFGKPRAANWVTDSTLDGTGATIKGLFSAVTTRGFTGHDHIDSVGLIHMNGRMYDPALGRFTGVDPFMTGPLNAQTLNPYSYVSNNPIMGTDPTGYAEQTTTPCGGQQEECTPPPEPKPNKPKPIRIKSKAEWERIKRQCQLNPSTCQDLGNVVVVGNGADAESESGRALQRMALAAAGAENGSDGAGSAVRDVETIHAELGGSLFKETIDGWSEWVKGTTSRTVEGWSNTGNVWSGYEYVPLDEYGLDLSIGPIKSGNEFWDRIVEKMRVGLSAAEFAQKVTLDVYLVEKVEKVYVKETIVDNVRYQRNRFTGEERVVGYAPPTISSEKSALSWHYERVQYFGRMTPMGLPHGAIHSDAADYLSRFRKK